MMVMVMEKRSAVKVKSLASKKIAFNIESEKRFARLVTIPLVTKQNTVQKVNIGNQVVGVAVLLFEKKILLWNIAFTKIKVEFERHFGALCQAIRPRL